MWGQGRKSNGPIAKRQGLSNLPTWAPLTLYPPDLAPPNLAIREGEAPAPEPATLQLLLICRWNLSSRTNNEPRVSWRLEPVVTEEQ